MEQLYIFGEYECNKLTAVTEIAPLIVMNLKEMYKNVGSCLENYICTLRNYVIRKNICLFIFTLAF